MAASSEQNLSDSSVDSEEIRRFSKIADEWWDPNGKFRPLHRFNPARLAYVREIICDHYGRTSKSTSPFEGLSLLDIGCGGGLLSEPMTRLGAQVLGADASERNVKTARAHAEQQGLRIDYQHTTAEALAQDQRKFDIVLNMEVIEHVADIDLFMTSCASLVRPGGLMFVATINKTLKAFALAIVGAEYVLGWLPRGTHSYEKFLAPGTITKLAARKGLNSKCQTGLSYNPFSDMWSRTSDMDVNYMLVFEKPGE